MFARLHPLLVHLPLGILLLAVGMAWLPGERAEKLRPAFAAVWLLGAASAGLACITGWFSAKSMGQDPLLSLHQWLGIGTAGLAAVVWFFREKIWANTGLRLAYTATVLVFSFATMHLGATLTHGEGYLFKSQADEAIVAPTTENGSGKTPEWLAEQPAAASESDVQVLVKHGISTVPVAAGSHWLSVNCSNAPAFSDSMAGSLERLAPQILWLKMSGTGIGDPALAHVGKLKNLTRLHLDGTRITDSGLAHLSELKNLQLLNLTGTSISAQGLASLRGLPNLQKIYLFQSAVKTSDWPVLRQIFPQTTLDTGGYHLETLPTDTARLRAK